MKTSTLKSIVLTGLLFLAVISAKSQYTANLIFSAKIEGAQQVPAVTTNALGVASLVLCPTRDTLCVNISVTGLSSPITEMHIHNAAVGVNGPDIIDLSGNVVGMRATTSITGPALAAIRTQLFEGTLYINVHTAANPNGEIRGQVLLETDQTYVSDLTGAQQVPAIVTNAGGLGDFRLSKIDSMFEFDIALYGLSSPVTEAHLHKGATGVNGAVVADLTSFIVTNGNSTFITGLINPTLFLTDLRAGNIYLNIHTSNNPNGEIRGQLIYKNNKFYMYNQLSPDQELSLATTQAVGIAVTYVNSTLDTLWYDIASTNGLTGNITGARFEDENGASTYMIPAFNINGNRVTGKITGTSLTNSLINDILNEVSFINLTTSVNATGEIRGGSQPMTRQAYTFSLDGMQQVPSVNSAATGSGLISIDHDFSNAYIAFTYSGLTATEAHLHGGFKGVNGQDIVDLSSMLSNNAVFGFINPLPSPEGFPMDSLYVNLHSAAYPDGEIRGQVLQGRGCYTIISGLSAVKSVESDLMVYPNPSTGVFNINLSADKTMPASLSVYDVVGKKVYSQELSLNTGKNQFPIDLSALNTGLYFVKIQMNNRSTVTRMTKE